MSHASRSAALLFTLVTLLGAAADATVARHRMTIEGGLPVVDVWIGRDGPYRFALDTGAEGSTVSRELATRLNLTVLGALEQHTLTGTARVPLVRVAALTIGRDGPVTSVAAAVTDLAVMRGVVRDLDGVLGGDALSGFDYVLDYEASRLTLWRGEAGDASAAPGGVSLPLRFDRRRPIVDWPTATDAEPAIPLVLDTGASALVVDEREAARFACLAVSQLVVLETHTGRRAVRSCQAGPLRAGSLAITGLQLVATPWPRAIERLDRGLLPASAFARVHVSPRRGVLTIWAR
jgi:Aspartyl protease